MAISLETQEQAKEIIESGLVSLFRGKVRFDTFRARSMLDEANDEFLQVSVVYEGNREELSPACSTHSIRKSSRSFSQSAYKRSP